VRLYRDEAVVLRSMDFMEADRIVTLLTREHGLVRAVAKGVRRSSSRFGGRLERFGVIDVQLHRGRNLDTVTQVETIAPYGRQLAADYSLFTSATAMVETAERLTAVEEGPAPQQYLLLIGALHAMANRTHAATLVLDSFLLRALAVAGWSPSCFDCARCGAEGPHRAWSSPMGGAVCADCRPPGSASPAAETMELLGALLSGDWSVADVSAGRSRSEASGLVASHLQWHLERRLLSLPLVERA
jgi:DNA repair protein RecO (recombination protein O)